VSEETATISRAYRMRFCPTRSQAAMLARLYGATRFVWNWALARRSAAYKQDGAKLNWISLSRDFTALRHAPETAWLAELPREPFAQALRDQERAFSNFFAKRAKYPRFRRRGGHAAVRFTLDQRREQVERGASGDRWAFADLPGLGRVKLRRTEILVGRLRSVTISRDGAGRYFASITADGVPARIAQSATVDAMGVDRGVRDLLVIHDGTKATRVPAAKALASKLHRLRRYQRRQTRQLREQMRAQGLDPTKPCPKGVRLVESIRRRRTRTHIARLHAGVADLRRDGLHRATTELVRSAQVIAIETLRVKAMARGMGRRAFRRSVADAAMGEVGRQLEYKAAWFGRVVVKVDALFPSSKTCSACGHVHRGLKLEKHWVCPHCSAAHDRDVNAAINLRNEGLRILAGLSPATGERPGSEARGADACAAGGSPPAGQPTAAKREPVLKPRKRRPVRAASGTRQAQAG